MREPRKLQSPVWGYKDALIILSSSLRHFGDSNLKVPLRSLSPKVQRFLFVKVSCAKDGVVEIVGRRAISRAVGNVGSEGGG